MLPELPPKVGPHYRVPWRRSDPSLVYVHTALDRLRGEYRSSERNARIAGERYQRAKTEFDLEAAIDIVNDVWNERVVDRVVDHLMDLGREPVIVIPHPEYDAGLGEIIPGAAPTNALPFAFANTLAEELGCDVDLEITEVARPGRTKLDDFERFLWQPRFAGPVNQDCAYVLMDDVCSVCGTFAALRSHIVEHGGTVASVTALAHGKGYDVQFPIAQDTLRMLQKGYGDEIDEYWRQEIGHGTHCLTEAEGQRLVRWFDKNIRAAGAGPAAFQCLRDRIAQAAASAGPQARP